MVAGVAGFGGALTSGPATFSAGGAGPAAGCPLTALQVACIDGGGFGGALAIEGVTHLGQPLEVWGQGGTHLGMTQSGLPRLEAAELWTTGEAEAYFIVAELDPVTPFLIEGTGTLRGLPGTFTGTGPAGFTVVTPMVVTADLPNSSGNARAIARLRVDLGSRPVPLAGRALVAAALGALGAVRLRHAGWTCPPEGYGSASARLTLSDVSDPGNLVVLLEADLPNPFASPPRELLVDLARTVGPGDYALLAEVSGSSTNTLFLPYAHVIQGTGSAQVTTELRVRPIPEPATALLVAISLAGLARRARET